jgi:hypothetical protein
MNSQQFEQEIKKLDPRFSIVPNPNRPGLSNIFFEGRNYDLPVIPSDDIRQEPDISYRYVFNAGMNARHNSVSDVMPRLEAFLEAHKKGAMKDLYD